MITPPRTATILIVEDDPGIAELERSQLEDAGYEAIVVASPDEALQELRRIAIDLVLLDYQLHGNVNGLDFHARMKSEGFEPPVILVTGFSSEATVIRALRAGIRDFVTKSLEYLDYLPEAVCRVLQQVGTERRLAESEARLAGVIESARDAVVVVGADLNVNLFNPAAERMFGCSAGNAIGRSITDFIPDDFRPEADPRTSQNRDSSVSRLRIGNWGVRAGGERFPLEASESLGEAGGHRFHTLMIRDVTLRKQTEADLRQTAELLRAVVEGTTDAVFVTDREGRYLLFNDAAARFVGRPAAEVLGKKATAVFDTEGAQKIMAQFQSVMSTGQAETDETTLIAAGITRTYLMTVAPYRNNEGGIIGVIGISRDITERLRLAAERDKLLGRLQLQIERMPLAYIVFDVSMQIVDWNPEAEQIFGYSKNEALQVTWFELSALPSEEQSRSILQQIEAGDKTFHVVSENIRKDGRTITCEWFCTPLMDEKGMPVGLFCLAQDVTARRASEEALRVRDRAIHAVTQGILITDPNLPDNPAVFASPGFERMTGYENSDIVGKNCRFLQGKDTDPVAIARLREAVREQAPCDVELLNYRKDGSAFWNELSISPVRDETGKLTHFVGVLTDVTERHRLEDQFRQAQKMKAVGQLAAGVAHDFNNLLTIINGYSDLLIQGLTPGDPMGEILAEIREAGERSAGLTRQLLAFSRQQVLSPEVIDLNLVVTGTEKLLRRVIGEDLSLTAKLSQDLWMARADPGQIEQVLMNLCVNARDAMPKGGRLTVETRNIELDTAYTEMRPDARPGPHVLVAVSDTGHGMTPEVMARIFEPFFTTKGLGKGTGLGLATVFGIVRQSGGHVGVYSELGLGTTFKIYLPKVDDELGIAPVRQEFTAPPRGNETILLAEDEEGVRSLTRRILMACGYTILEAADGDQAMRLAAIHAGPIDLLVTDVVMPAMGGRNLAERLGESRPGIKILYLSGYTDDAVVRHGILHDQMNFLQKPFTPSILARKVRDVLDDIN